MTIPPGPDDLTNVADVAAYLGQPVTQDSDLIQALVTAASAFIVNWTGCGFASAPCTDVRDGTGRETMVLANAPVTAIGSVTIDGVSIPATSGWPQCGYGFDGTSLYLSGYSFRLGRRNVSVGYTAGYAAVPADVAQACVELVAYRYRLRDKTGLVSEGALQQTTAYSQADMPQSVVSALAPYRRVFA